MDAIPSRILRIRNSKLDFMKFYRNRFFLNASSSASSLTVEIPDRRVGLRVESRRDTFTLVSKRKKRKRRPSSRKRKRQRFFEVLDRLSSRVVEHVVVDKRGAAPVFRRIGKSGARRGRKKEETVFEMLRGSGMINGSGRVVNENDRRGKRKLSSRSEMSRVQSSKRFVQSRRRDPVVFRAYSEGILEQYTNFDDNNLIDRIFPSYSSS